MAPLTKQTVTYATHQVPLECDIYEASDYPKDSPAVLFFHSGGLVAGHRICVPPWLVQVCYRNKMPLISASWRVIPQVDGDGLIADAQSAYEFARHYGGSERRVIAAGASGGGFMPFVIAHHLEPKPLALLEITGIPTVHHKFFNSSSLIPAEPIKEEEVEQYLAEGPGVGPSPYGPAVFYLDSLLPSGAKNPAFKQPDKPPAETVQGDGSRGMLYDYYLYLNMFPALVGKADPGLDWTAGEDEAAKEKLAAWPMTLIIQGDADDDVDADVCISVAKKLGARGRLFLEKGAGHLFEMNKFIEDEAQGMDTVREAVQALEQIISSA